MPERRIIRFSAKRRKLTPGERLNAIMPTLQWDTLKALGKRPVALAPSGQVIQTLNDFVLLCARNICISDRSLWRWRKRFLESGGNLEVLRDRPRRDKGASHIFQGRALAVSVVCGLRAQGHSARGIYSALSEIWPDLYPGSRVPSYATVRAFIHSISLPEGVTAVRATELPS
jgi:hypothetical protein